MHDPDLALQYVKKLAVDNPFDYRLCDSDGNVVWSSVGKVTVHRESIIYGVLEEEGISGRESALKQLL